MYILTIYITNYNYKTFLKQSIESVLNQTLSGIELIIIDDGSNDGSSDIIEEYRTQPNVSIIYQNNKGLNVTNNIALRIAKGKYIMRLDADDFLESYAAEILVEVLEKNPDVGLVFPDYYYVDKNGNRTGLHQRHDFDKEVSLFDQPAHGACTMIRVQMLRELGGYNEQFSCQDGYDLWLKFISKHRVLNVNRPLFSYRRHTENLTNNENRILTTRQEIKKVALKANNKSQTCAIIPVRDTLINGINWPLYQVGGKSVIQRKVEMCRKAETIKKIVITTSSEEIINHILENDDLFDGVELIIRDPQLEAANIDLNPTVEHVLNQVFIGHIECITVVSLDYPFVTHREVDECIHTLDLFNAYSVITVREENKQLYKHTGEGMIRINDTCSFNKLERESVYVGAGGIISTTLNHFKKHKQLLTNNITHVLVPEKTAFCVDSNFKTSWFKFLSISE